MNGNHREGWARLCGYGARPALSLDRLSALPDGRLAIQTKRPLADGRELRLEPVEFASASRDAGAPTACVPRSFPWNICSGFEVAQRIVPAAPAESVHEHRGSEPTLVSPAEPDKKALLADPSKPRRPDAKIPWAELLQRVFREDVLACPCGGRRRVIALITERAVVKAILEHLGLPTNGPPIAPTRSTAPPRLAPWQDDVPSLQQALR